LEAVINLGISGQWNKKARNLSYGSRIDSKMGKTMAREQKNPKTTEPLVNP
jgi:hypothetical protein